MRRFLLPGLLIVLGLLTWQRTRVAAILLSVTNHVTADPAADRVAEVRPRRGEEVKALCTKAGLTYPPKELFLRGFKAERELEAWARNDGGEFRRIITWPVLAASGDPGPKRMEGDRQVPEGCYKVAVFNPRSRFHLSLGLDYPNASDRVRSDREKPGGEIYIHGSNASIGCLALGDPAIEELYLLALDSRTKHGGEIAVHLFPTRMQGENWEQLKATTPEHTAFWQELEPIYLAFEKTHRRPAVQVDSNGRYSLK